MTIALTKQAVDQDSTYIVERAGNSTEFKPQRAAVDAVLELDNTVARVGINTSSRHGLSYRYTAGLEITRKGGSGRIIKQPKMSRAKRVKALAVSAKEVEYILID